jgi:hypothetical protein
MVAKSTAAAVADEGSRFLYNCPGKTAHNSAVQVCVGLGGGFDSKNNRRTWNNHFERGISSRNTNTKGSGIPVSPTSDLATTKAVN